MSIAIMLVIKGLDIIHIKLIHVLTKSNMSVISVFFDFVKNYLENAKKLSIYGYFFNYHY
jgi:hypothetical protein